MSVNGDIWKELTERCEDWCGVVKLHVRLGAVLKWDLDHEIVNGDMRSDGEVIKLADLWPKLDDALHTGFNGQVRFMTDVGYVSSAVVSERGIPECRQTSDWGSSVAAVS